MAKVIATDFDIEDVPPSPGRIRWSKYFDLRKLLFEHKKLKLEVEMKPEGSSLGKGTHGQHEGNRIYQALRYYFKRHPEHGVVLHGRQVENTLWLWLEERNKGE